MNISYFYFKIVNFDFVFLKGSDYIQSIEELQIEKMHRTQALLVKWERARLQHSPRPYLKNQSNFLHTSQARSSNSIVQFDQEQNAFHTKLI